MRAVTTPAVMVRAVTTRVVVALVAGVMAAGCTGNGSGAPVTSTTTPPPVTASTTSTPTPSAPALPAAAKVNTRAGAEAFFRYFWDVYNYSYATLDVTAMRAIIRPECTFCSDSVEDLTAAADDQRGYEGGRIVLGALVAGPIDAQETSVVNAVASQAAGRLVASDGTTVRAFPAQSNARVDAAVRWENSRWTVVEVSIRSGTSTS